MMNKLSFKIGMLFFVFIVLVEVLLFFVLYTNLANNQVDEVMDNLLARGNTHRDVLEDNYSRSTMDHVRIMEAASDFVVVITDTQGQVLVKSNPIEYEIEQVIQRVIQAPIDSKGEIVEKRWKDKKYIASDSLIVIDNEIKGHVLMFAKTNKVKNMLDQLSYQFKIIGLLTLILTIITIFILSKLITAPLKRIKEASEQIYNENKQIDLNTKRKDELGVLARTITRISKDLDQLKAERTEFLSNISHELRTPLTYIKGYADVLNRPDLSGKDTRKYSLIIKEEAEQLSLLVKNLFDLAKVDQNKFDINKEWVSLCEIIQSVTERMRPAFNEKQLTIDTKCPADLIALVDPSRLQQVLINVLDNAKKHSYENSVITLKVKEDLQHINIIVDDEGEGIPKEEIPYLFNRLYRVEKSRSRLSGGSGIGLTIAKEIVESHGGVIHIDSEIGVGTTVTIALKKGEISE
ncbi:HAMP domain-containing histidine kinase [Filobacillus milosensis]|uniref:histidine kinase n=1 Tax=Filobacillus milosensis TaxID=94137 RepID=A0A4Y8IX72_9BACI|nr:HAMP domain-containing sensor histidine kinase [Filobacillus milosensis]TFB25015.1 HAMP domain-containing histidine kinase [Filobacillus milosensis]